MHDDEKAFVRRIIIVVVLLAVVGFFSLCFMGAQGQYYLGSNAYAVYTPQQVVNAIAAHMYNFVGSITHLWNPHPDAWMLENVLGAFAIPQKAQVLGITMLCAVLLSVSGMLYQNVFKNPIAGPGLLGVSSGVSIGVMVLVLTYGTAASTMVTERYALCYGLGAAILVLVIFFGTRGQGGGKRRRKSHGRRTFDVMGMILLGMVVSRFAGSIVDFVMLYLADDELYLAYYEVSQMLSVDTSLLSWTVLAIAFVVSFVPVVVLRARMNVLVLDGEEARTLGADLPKLRAVALVCGGVMILAAQVHVGMVGLISLLVPFIVRGWFGCDFRKQLAGNVCVGMLFLVCARSIADAIPFVGDGLAVSTIVAVAALPVVMILFRSHARGWE